MPPFQAEENEATELCNTTGKFRKMFVKNKGERCRKGWRKERGALLFAFYVILGTTIQYKLAMKYLFHVLN